MRKLNLLCCAFALLSATGLASCGKTDTSKVIKVCASDVPHAEVLNGIAKSELAKKGYTLEVSVTDWTLQNDAVAKGDYDANYFQHIPYLETYTGTTELVATCKVHYEPLGIYKGNGKVSDLSAGKTFEICNDTSNAIRAFQLLKAKGVLSTIPVNEAGDELTFTGSTWTETSSNITVTLIEESLLVASLASYDFACLPCNTAYTGNISSSLQVAKEDDPDQVSLKANVIAVRKADYLAGGDYKAKIDALTDVMLSEAVANFFKEKYLGAMTCDSSSQIDLRSSIK